MPASAPRTVVYVPTKSLRRHPKNTEIYLENSSEAAEARIALSKSVRERGILTPIVVTKDGRIVSGHRRWRAAKDAGLQTVPVIVAEFGSEAEELLALVDANAQREKTEGERAAEFRIARDAHAQLARERMSAARRASKEGTEGLFKRTTPADEFCSLDADVDEDVAPEKPLIGPAVELTSQQVGWSGGKGRKFDVLDHNARDLADRVVKGELTVGAAYSRYRERVDSPTAVRSKPKLGAVRQLPTALSHFHKSLSQLLSRVVAGDIALSDEDLNKVETAIKSLTEALESAQGLGQIGLPGGRTVNPRIVDRAFQQLAADAPQRATTLRAAVKKNLEKEPTSIVWMGVNDILGKLIASPPEVDQANSSGGDSQVLVPGADVVADGLWTDLMTLWRSGSRTDVLEWQLWILEIMAGFRAMDEFQLLEMVAKRR